MENPDQTSLRLLYHSPPSMRKRYFSQSSENFLLPFGTEYSRITKAVLRRQLRSRSRAMKLCEPCQAGNRAALSGMFHVPRGNRLRSCLRRTAFVFYYILSQMATKNFPIFKKGPAVLKTAGPHSSLRLTCCPRRTYRRSAPPSCWRSQSRCHTRRQPSRSCRSG